MDDTFTFVEDDDGATSGSDVSDSDTALSADTSDGKDTVDADCAARTSLVDAFESVHSDVADGISLLGPQGGKYYTTHNCKKCGDTRRYVSTGVCVTCIKEATLRSLRKRKERQKLAQAA